MFAYSFPKALSDGVSFFLLILAARNFAFSFPRVKCEFSSFGFPLVLYLWDSSVRGVFSFLVRLVTAVSLPWLGDICLLPWIWDNFSLPWFGGINSLPWICGVDSLPWFGDVGALPCFGNSCVRTSRTHLSFVPWFACFSGIVCLSVSVSGSIIVTLLPSRIGGVNG